MMRNEYRRDIEMNEEKDVKGNDQKVTKKNWEAVVSL